MKKLDQGLKYLLRGVRDQIVLMFDLCLTSEGSTFLSKKYYWTEAELLEKVREFMYSELSLEEPSEIDIWCVTLLVYSAIGPTKKKMETTNAWLIGEELMETFFFIYSNPTTDRITEFMRNPLMCHIWERVAPSVRRDQCFKPNAKGSTENIKVTFYHITALF